MVAWARAIHQYHMNGTDTVGRSVSRSVGRSVGRLVDARGPVDHASVGLAQARPNESRCLLLFTGQWKENGCVTPVYLNTYTMVNW